MIIDGIEYTILEFNNKLESQWLDGRPYIHEYYELLNEEIEEFVHLTIWSDDHFELTDKPISAIPFLTGDISEIRGI